MIQNILFPTDFSKNAENALHFAVDLAKKNVAKLILLHAFEVPLMAPENSFSTREMTMNKAGQRIFEIARKKMKQLVVDFELEDVTHEISIRRGRTHYEIQEAIAKFNIDLIAMGTKGETGKLDLFMGSVTKGLLQHVDCPILAIPQDCSMREIRRIAYATDLKNDDTKAVAYLIKIAEFYNATLIILHVDENKDKQQEHIEALKELVGKTDYPNIAYKEIVVHEVSQGIENYVEQNQIDMLAMITNTTSIFEKIMHRSLTKKMLFHTHIPLLTLNRKKEDIILL
jgi:nucleotide-binding universal stress UspA family protein